MAKYDELTESETGFCDAAVSGVVQHATTKKLRIDRIDGIREAIAEALIDGREKQQAASS